jgi:hypothetical protein
VIASGNQRVDSDSRLFFFPFCRLTYPFFFFSYATLFQFQRNSCT